MTEFMTVREQIDALPEPERSARRKLYSTDDWNNKWELNCWEHQIPPLGDDWLSWTVIGGRRTGSTTAGYKWMEQKFFTVSGTRKPYLVVTHHRHEVTRIADMFLNRVDELNATDFTKIQTSPTRKVIMVGGMELHIVQQTGDPRWPDSIPLRRFDYDYVWADEIDDAKLLMQILPMTKQFVFTQPVKLPDDTILSRAGDSRTRNDDIFTL